MLLGKLINSGRVWFGSVPTGPGDQAMPPGDGLCLHVGCGSVKLPGWINIDSNSECQPDRVMSMQEIPTQFALGSVRCILSIHSINYLRRWEAEAFFQGCFGLLAHGGQLIIETPMFDQISGRMVHALGDPREELECIRAVFAFGLDDMASQRAYEPYKFAWTRSLLADSLRSVGFKEVTFADPVTHGKLRWRDSRIVATKA